MHWYMAWGQMIERMSGNESKVFMIKPQPDVIMTPLHTPSTQSPVPRILMDSCVTSLTASCSSVAAAFPLHNAGAGTCLKAAARAERSTSSSGQDSEHTDLGATLAHQYSHTIMQSAQYFDSVDRYWKTMPSDKQ